MAMVEAIPYDALFLIAEFAPKTRQVSRVCRAMAAGSAACPPKAMFIGWHNRFNQTAFQRQWLRRVGVGRLGRIQHWEGWTCGVRSVNLSCHGPLWQRAYPDTPVITRRFRCRRCHKWGMILNNGWTIVLRHRNQYFFGDTLVDPRAELRPGHRPRQG